MISKNVSRVVPKEMGGRTPELSEESIELGVPVLTREH